ncbi:hypothetical protein GF357_03090 [Candidatus Dojkabacteria bacterium]|nr:hypothetical protein [Candidatus Dojkabacteria bacterium]
MQEIIDRWINLFKRSLSLSTIVLIVGVFILTSCGGKYNADCWTAFSENTQNVSQSDLIGIYTVDFSISPGHDNQSDDANEFLPQLDLRGDGSFAIYNFQGNEFAWETSGVWPDSISGKWFLVGREPGEDLMVRLSVEREGFRDLYSESYLVRRGEAGNFVIIDVKGDPDSCEGYVFRML